MSMSLPHTFHILNIWTRFEEGEPYFSSFSGENSSCCVECHCQIKMKTLCQCFLWVVAPCFRIQNFCFVVTSFSLFFLFFFLFPPSRAFPSGIVSEPHDQVLTSSLVQLFTLWSGYLTENIPALVFSRPTNECVSHSFTCWYCYVWNKVNVFPQKKFKSRSYKLFK